MSDGVNVHYPAPNSAAQAALRALTPAADQLPYFTSGSAAALTSFTAAGRALVDDASASAQRTTLALSSADTVQFALLGVGGAVQSGTVASIYGASADSIIYGLMLANTATPTGDNVQKVALILSPISIGGSFSLAPRIEGVEIEHTANAMGLAFYAYDGGGHNIEVMRIDSGQAGTSTPHVSIGVTASLGGVLSVQAADGGTVLDLKINATQANVTAADVFANFRSTSGIEGSIAGTGVAGVIAYNTFTGSHYTQIDGPEPEVLALLEAIEGLPTWPAVIETIEAPRPDEVDAETGEVTSFPGETVVIERVHEASDKDYLPMTRVCSTRKSRAAFGFYGGTNLAGQAMAFALGTGAALVLNTGADLAIGDYLMSSDEPGLCEVQDDDLLHNYTVAKLTQPVRWEPGETQRRVPCTYHCG